MKIKIFSAWLFLTLLFVLPFNEKTNANEVRRGSDPPFVCKEVLLPKIHSGIKKKIVSEDGQKTLIVFVAFSGQNTEDGTSEEEQEAKESLFTGEKSVSRYYEKITQGKIIIDGDVLSSWKSLPKTHSEYSENRIPGDLDTPAILTDTIIAIDDEVNLADYQRIIIFLKGGYYSVGFGTQGKWDGIDSDDGSLSLSVCWIGIESISNQFVLRHEIGHTLDWGHAGSTILKENETCSEVCSAKDINEDLSEDWPPSECTGYEYGNELDIMGNGGVNVREKYSTSVFNLLKIGAVNDDQVFEVKENATVTLIPRSSNSQEGFRLVSIKGIDDDGTKKTYYAELYAKIEENFDSGTDKSQIILYCSNENGYLDRVSTLRFMSQNEKTGYSPLDFKKTSFCDPVSGVQIELIDEYGEGENARVEIKITLNCPPEEKNPIVSVSSDYNSIDITTGLERSFEVKLSIINNEAMACGTRTFNITAKLPEKWIITSLPSSVDIGPFSSFEMEISVWIPENTIDGFYKVTIQVADSENQELKGEESFTVEVFHKEIILEVEINEVKAANNDIVVVAKGDWVRVRASAFDWYDENIMEDLTVDKITCQIKNRKGKNKYYKEIENDHEGNFLFKAKRRGEFSLEVEAFKEGYETASFQAKIKAQ